MKLLIILLTIIAINTASANQLISSDPLPVDTQIRQPIQWDSDKWTR